MKPNKLILALALGAMSAAMADTVVTTDGARLTGKIVKADGGDIVLKTDYAGTITISQAKVASFTTDEAINVRTKAGDTVQGTVTEANGNLTVKSASTSLTTKPAEVATIWPAGAKDPAIAALERKWKYRADADLTKKTGNTKSDSYAMGLLAKLESKDDTFKIYGTYAYSSQRNVRTTDETKGGVDYQAFFSPVVGWYVKSELERDNFEAIKLRSTTAGGLSYRIWDEPKHKLKARTGLSFRYEDYDLPKPILPGTETSDSNFGLNFGLSHEWQFAKWAVLRNELEYTPSFEDVANYIITHDSGVEMPLGLSDFWKLRVGVHHDYNSQARTGLKDLDTTLYAKLILDWE
jgi:putative salt-induced outer membrane protein YdiY